MKRLILFLAACALALLAACGTTGSKSVNGQLQAGYDTLAAYVVMTETSLARGRITPDQAAKASATAKSSVGKLDAARAALAACKPPTPCTDYLALLQGLQPSLLELELQLRAAEAAKGSK